MANLSVHREVEAVKEAVAVKAILACAQWLRDHDEPDIAEKMAAEMLEEDAGDPRS